MDIFLEVRARELKRGSVKCRLQTDCRLLFLQLENNGTIVVTCICMVKTIVCSLHFTLTGIGKQSSSFFNAIT